MSLRTFASSSDDRVIAGVCAGIAQTPAVDATLVSDHYGRIFEPNHLRRSLEILETLGTLEGFNDSQEDLKRGSAAMSHEARKRLATPSWSRDAFSVHLQDEERVDRSILGAWLMQGKREAGRVYLPHACVLRLCCSCELLLRSRRYVRVIRLLGATARPSVR